MDRVMCEQDRDMKKSGVVAVVGRTNAGKSTLINRLLNEKVSIVSPVAQTTRNVIRGVWNGDRGQIVLLDTPGVHRAQSELGRIMNRMARRTARGADAILLLADGSEAPRAEDEGWIRRLSKEQVPTLPVLNKSDAAENHRAEYERLWQAARAAQEPPPEPATRPRELNPRQSVRQEGESGACQSAAQQDQRDGPCRLARQEPEIEGEATSFPPPTFTRDARLCPGSAWLAISAKTGDGLPALTEALFAALPEGPPLFPEEMLTDFPRKLAMADIVREKLLGQLREELPHAIAAQIERLDDAAEPWEVDGIVYVSRHSQKGIVIGHKGRLIRKVQRQAEAELTAVFGHAVRLRLRVKVQERWHENFWMLKQLGYVE